MCYDWEIFHDFCGIIINIYYKNLIDYKTSHLKFRRHGGIFSLYHRESEVTMLKERFKKILINLGSKIVKCLDISIV